MNICTYVISKAIDLQHSVPSATPPPPHEEDDAEEFAWCLLGTGWVVACCSLGARWLHVACWVVAGSCLAVLHGPATHILPGQM